MSAIKTNSIQLGIGQLANTAFTIRNPDDGTLRFSLGDLSSNNDFVTVSSNGQFAMSTANIESLLVSNGVITNLSVTSISGNGAGLTTVSSNSLVGALPALDGSALTSLSSNSLVGALPALDGSALTSLSSNSLVGALPALDGSALTGIASSRVTKVASGTLSNGDVVILNSDGTVSIVTATVGPPDAGSPVVFESAISEYISVAYIGNDKVVIGYRDGGNSNYGTAIVGTISGTSISFGSPVVFESANSLYFSVASIGNDKVVIGYMDNGNSNYGTAIVGTISGTSISFGSPVVFESASSPYISVASIGNDKVVIGYRDDGNSGYGTAVVGTVTGTSISFGSPVVFESASSLYFSVASIGNDKVVIGYRDNGNSSYGTAIVGTISGTSISFGSPVVFESAISSYISVAYIGNDKVVIGYRDDGNSFYGTAIVGTISGTSISFGSPVVFESAQSDYFSVASIGNDKVVIGYRDNGNSSYGTAIVGTVSGTSISFGSPVVFESANSDYFSVASIGNDKVVIGYRDNGNSGYGTSLVFQAETTTTNAADWLGISESSVTNAEATIAIFGAVANNQANLVPNSIYYVSANGSLTTSNTIYGIIGRAISNTELLITEGNT